MDGVATVFAARVKDAALSQRSDDNRLPYVSGYVWATRITTLGLQVALPALAGWGLDRRWGTAPWMLIVGSMLGIAVFGQSVLRLSREGGGRPPHPPSESSAKNS